MNFFGWITEGTRKAVLKGFELAAADLNLHHAADDDAGPLAALEARTTHALPAPAEESRAARRSKTSAA